MFRRRIRRDPLEKVLRGVDHPVDTVAQARLHLGVGFGGKGGRRTARIDADVEAVLAHFVHGGEKLLPLRLLVDKLTQRGVTAQ